MRSPLRLLGLLLLTWLLAACGGQPERIWLKAPDWSRAQTVGVTATGDAPVFALGPQGRTAFLLVAHVDGRYHPRVVAFDEQGALLWERDYADISMPRPDQPRVFWTPEGIALFWISEESLFHGVVDPTSGDFVNPPRKLSGDLRVGDYDVAVAEDGRLAVWFGGPRRAPGLYAFPPDDLSGAPLLVDEQGLRPQLAWDSQGQLHALWIQHPQGETGIRMFYQTGDGVRFPSSATEVMLVRVGQGSVFVGPALGMDASNIYLFWSIEVRTGLAAGSVDARYTFFPRERPQEAAPPIQLFTSADYHLDYIPWPEGEIRAGRRAHITPPLTGKLMQFQGLKVDLPETAVIQKELVRYIMRDKAYQTGILFFQDGEPTSYQLLSFTPGETRSPYLTLDQERYVHAAWLERAAQGFRLVYASTRPEIVTAYNALSASDYAAFLGQTLFGMMSGALLLPFAMMWMILPLILFLITFPLRRGSNELHSPGTLISLGLSILGYWILKIAMLADVTDFIPFSPWIPVIPDWMGPVLQLVVPAIILAVSLTGAWLATYRRQTYSPMLFLLVYLAVDGIFTTAIYGPIFLGSA